MTSVSVGYCTCTYVGIYLKSILTFVLVISSSTLTQSHHLDSIINTKCTIAKDACDPLPSEALDTPLSDICTRLLMASCNCLLCYVDTYVDNFVTMEQGGPRLWHQVHRHLFHDMYCVILPNKVDKSSQKDPNLNKKLCCSDTTWTTCKQVLGWLIDILRHQINPPLLLTIQFYLRPGQVPPWPTINHLPPVGMACCYFVQNHTRPIKRRNSVCLDTMGPQPDRHPHLTYAWVPQ